jgi:hypothetical protein
MWWIMNSSDHAMVTAMIGIAANGAEKNRTKIMECQVYVWYRKSVPYFLFFCCVFDR